MTLRPTAARVARDARRKLPFGTQKLNPVQSLALSFLQSSESEESTLKAGQLGKRQYPMGLCQHCDKEKKLKSLKEHERKCKLNPENT